MVGGGEGLVCSVLGHKVTGPLHYVLAGDLRVCAERRYGGVCTVVRVACAVAGTGAGAAKLSVYVR